MPRKWGVQYATFALVAMLLPCDVHASPRRDAASAGAQGGPRLFDPATLHIAESAPIARAVAALERGDFAAARSIAQRAIPRANRTDAGRLRWIGAKAAEGAEDVPGALRLLQTLGRSSHPLALWARLRRAELLEWRDAAEAAREAEELGRMRWVGRSKALTVEARSLARAGRVAAAIPKLRALVEATPDHIGAASSGMPLADLLASRTDDASREQALQLYRRIATRAPLTDVGRDADTKATSVLSRLSPERRARLSELPFEDAFAKAQALFNGLKHAEAEVAFAEIATRVANDPERLCEALVMQGRAMLRRRARQEGAQHMEGVAARCAQPGVHASALYHAGKTYAALGDQERGITHLRELVDQHPDSNLADDALYRIALLRGEAGDNQTMIAQLEEVARRWPQGDMASEARFRLAWEARSRGDYTKALEHFDRATTDGLRESTEDLQGRTAYWRARTLRDLGRAIEAVDSYEGIVRAWPLSYYAQQSLARLAQLEPARVNTLMDAMRGPDPEPLRFEWRAELDSPAFQRAVELLSVREFDRAQQELAFADATSASANQDMIWLAVALLAQVDAHPQAIQLVRQRLGSFRRTMPVGRNAALWRLAYPKAYAPLIDQIARNENVPASLVRAIAREESSFNPEAESIAHAHGLIQLMEPTARRFARLMRLPTSPESLRKPEVNLRIGTHFISFLWQRYATNPNVLPAAYNAGEGAADRWLRERPNQPLDVWIEEIPYEETRRYTRRVLQSYGIYTWLDEGRLPELPTTLPRR